MDPAGHIAAIKREGAVLAAAAQRAGLAAPVPSCPAWQVRDLLRHIGYVHRWAAGYVAQQLAEEGPGLTEAEQLAGGPPDSELLAWFRAGHAALTSTLASASPDMACWTFLPAPTPLAFWARRAAHETAIHGADAQLAAGEEPVFAPDLAADGVDEMLLAFYGRDGASQDGADAAGGAGAAGRTVRIRAADTGDQWFARISAGDGRAELTGRGPGPVGPAGCELAGPAASLYRLLWKRAGDGTGDITVTGNGQLLQDWQAGRRLVWA
ncbi:MAG TPA: maleylpyruvate isomerase family mycothiol-dependent enzyme [Streptosporangiaceae bacterium]|nr:maleylpyruvate isomerase family mycothiol-dependent enzyme [Streptosporangiaceae bacterium]